MIDLRDKIGATSNLVHDRFAAAAKLASESYRLVVLVYELRRRHQARSLWLVEASCRHLFES